MSLYHRVAFYLFPITLLALAIYSYALIDPNITLFNHPAWTSFRNTMVQFGYYQKPISSAAYLLLLVLLFYCSAVLTKHAKHVSAGYLLMCLGFVSILSYPFLSHDIFNYMFDAKIFTFYHQNPYLHRALDFPQDEWLRFMHWTHRTYPYGPTFLILSLIPSFLAGGKLILNILFFKSLVFSIFWISVALLIRINKAWGVFYATSPLVIIEGLVNGHNDILGVSLAIIGVYYLQKKKNLWGRLVLLLSGGVKYITLPLVVLPRFKMLVFAAMVAVLLYLSFFTEIQAWYFLVLFVFLPFYEELLRKASIFFAGLLFAYYPFVREASWTPQAISEKHIIILWGILLNTIYFGVSHLKRLRK